MILIGLLSVVLAQSVFPPDDKPPSEMDKAVAQLQGTPREQKKAVGYVLAHTAAAPAAAMYIAAAKSLELGRLEDAGFLYYAAQLRARFDLKRFPPVGKGGDSPGVALAAVSQQVGSAVNPAVMRDPKLFKTVIARVRAWDVNTVPGYDPGWKFALAPPPAEARAFSGSVKDEYLKPAEGLVTLLDTPEYFEAWRIVQDANFAPYDGKPHPERDAEKAQAEKRLREIEERMGIEGLFYRKDSPPDAAPAPAPPAPRPGADRQQAIAQLKARGFPRPDDADQYVGSALQGDAEVVRLFLKAGMPVDTPNHLGDHAFLSAIQGRYITLAAEILKAGANPNLPDQNGYTPLIELASFCDETAIVADVIKAGGDVKAKARNGKTPLSVSRETECTEISRLLKKAGALR
jgi:hypothetical protein